MAKVDNPYPICNYNIFIVEFIVRYVISSMSYIPNSFCRAGGSFEKLVFRQINNMAHFLFCVLEVLDLISHKSVSPFVKCHTLPHLKALTSRIDHGYWVWQHF